MFAKLWESHVVAELGDDTALLHVDRHILHDLGGSRALLDVKERGLPVHNPELTFATVDHTISSSPGRQDTIARGVELMKALRTETAAVGIRLFDVGQPGQGIVHVMGPSSASACRGASSCAAIATPARMAASVPWLSAWAGASLPMSLRPKPSTNAGRAPCW
jgi:3-isopropylmalate/(R)-2-methylmalate dehydratase large subunit